jgi:hypothetical protein
MRLDVKNFGPIAEATNIAITPMTIIIGRNNMGKSFLSQLMFSLTSTMRAPKRRTRLDVGPHAAGVLDVPEFFVERVKESKQFKVELYRLKKQSATTADFLNFVVDSFATEYVRVVNMLFGGSLERTFGVSLKELVKFGSESSEILLKLSPSASFRIHISKNGAV